MSEKEKTGAVNPNSTDDDGFLVRRDLAVAYLAMARVEDAVRELEIALTIRPGDEECRVLLLEAKKPPTSSV